MGVLVDLQIENKHTAMKNIGMEGMLESFFKSSFQLLVTSSNHGCKENVYMRSILESLFCQKVEALDFFSIFYAGVRSIV